ncbi:MAG: phytoene/squalene synthase family protein [Solirubrobacteraceae bacterium]|nr:phytoene/squalene synthase family protein [Solirubrobacteraceae bacterium]
MSTATAGRRSPAARSALAEARATHRAIGRTFWLASRLLPRGVRDDVHLLYLVLRTLDDAVDDRRPGARQIVEGVELWAATGQATTREALLMKDLATRYAIDRGVVADFCAGMHDDLSGRVLTTEEQLDTYCYRVAGTVGVLMIAFLGSSDAEAARRPAIALGQAMQRTNILRDIDEDVAAGRMYLATETVERFGSIRPGERAALLTDQIARADALYDEGIAGIAYLSSGRRAIGAAAAMYREILRQIERDGLGTHPGRAVVPLSRKARAAFGVQRQLRPAP